MTTLETILSIGLIIAVGGCIYLYWVKLILRKTVKKILQMLGESYVELNRRDIWLGELKDELKNIQSENHT